MIEVGWLYSPDVLSVPSPRLLCYKIKFQLEWGMEVKKALELYKEAIP